ncbi:bacterio-opsin activator [Halovenus sp. WSH3]|uniref:Bacterio-opsin activator n=1 Tax=Halovenus carboxidivorans TaxID=2692199 RepID=A0A6B0T644_9EURY|nr:helix-turn-helix domain-containing protein [Halovenus carboxidivorans]MXR51043.1 bacterio-opsin activator [Halovenus carboxidivorans]
MSGVRAEFVFERPEQCPVAASSAGADSPLRDVSWTTESDGIVTEQFTTADEPATDEAEEVFDYGAQRVYEFERDYDDPCICEYIEQSLGPVTDAYATGGNLHVTIHAGDVEKLRELLGELNDRFGTVRIEYLVQGRDQAAESNLVPVDLRRLTDRQQEVLQTAHEMGYFEYPRNSNASEVSEALGIEPSTFTEHLNAAQSKLLDELLARE